MAGEKAAAIAILAEPGYQITVDGYAVPLQQVDPSQLWNFYHVASLLMVYASYRHKAVRAIKVLDDPPGTLKGSMAPALEAVRRCGMVDDLDRFQLVRAATEAPIALVDDAEFQTICRDIVACFEKTWTFYGIVTSGIGFLSQRVVVAFDTLQDKVKAEFVTLRPVLQELMGRPSDDRIDAAIVSVEAGQERLDALLDDFKVYVAGLTVAEERIPDPTQPMTSTENEARVKQVRYQLSSLIREDEATLDLIVEAMVRCSGMFLTLVTAIQQIDQRLETFGVS